MAVTELQRFPFNLVKIINKDWKELYTELIFFPNRMAESLDKEWISSQAEVNLKSNKQKMSKWVLIPQQHLLLISQTTNLSSFIL